MENRLRLLSISWAVLAFVLATGSLTGCSSPADPSWQRLQETRTLRVGMDASFPPFESISADGSLVGFDVDLARELSRRLGVQAQFVANLPYDGLYDALKAERVDIVISALVVDPSRMEDYAYSRVYFDAGYVLVSHAGQQPVESITDLAGHSLAVVLGTEGDRVGRRWARRMADLVVVQYPSPSEALGALGRGETDIALINHISALQAIGDGGDFAVVGEPVIAVPYACAVRRDSVHLLKAVNNALLAMEEDGTMEELVSTWLK